MDPISRICIATNEALPKNRTGSHCGYVGERHAYETRTSGVASGFACSAAAPEAISRMGFAESDLGAQSWLAMFRKALTKLGWLEGASSRSETVAGASKL